MILDQDGGTRVALLLILLIVAIGGGLVVFKFLFLVLPAVLLVALFAGPSRRSSN